MANSMMMAHAVTRVRAANQRVLEHRPPRRPRVHYTALLKAIKGSRGIKSLICERLGGLSYGALVACLNKWPAAMDLFKEEEASIIDTARNAILDNLDQQVNLQVRQRAAEYLLDRRDPDFKPKSQVEVEGGSQPIKVAQVSLNLDVESLKRLPLDVRRQVLAAMETNQPLPPEIEAAVREVSQPPKPEGSEESA